MGGREELCLGIILDDVVKASFVNLYSDIRSLSSSLPVKLCTSSPIPMNYVAATSLPVECRSLSNAAGFLQVVAVPVTAANTVVQCLIST